MGLLAEVQVTVRSDESGMPLLDAGKRTMVVQIPGDFEGNLMKTGAALDGLFEEVHADVNRQIARMQETEEEAEQFERERQEAERRDRVRGRPRR